MENNIAEEFAEKFKKLSNVNQRYIIAIQQALIFAQSKTDEEASNNEYEQLSLFDK